MSEIDQVRVEAACKAISMMTKTSGVAFRLENEPYLADEIPCSGYFDSKGKVLAVATGRPEKEWLTTLIHEFCHLLQWKEDADVWRACFVDSMDASDVLDGWLSGSQAYSEEQVDKAIFSLIELELDCEVRTTAFIRYFNLPIDLSEYAQKANAYIAFYHQIRRTRKWYDPAIAPYALETVWREMPTDFASLDYSDPEACLSLADFSLCQSA